MRVFAGDRPAGARLVLLGLLVLVLAAAVAGAYLWPDYLFRSGQQALARHDFPQAQRAFERYLWYRPRSAPAHLLAARAARRHDALDDARRHLTACQDLGGAGRDCAVEGCLLRAQQGELNEVEGALQSFLDQEVTEAPLILEALSKGCLASSRPGDALDAAEALLHQDPDNPAAHRCYARAAEALHHRAEALPHYLRAVELDPENDDTRLDLADCLAYLGRPQEAMAQYDALLHRRPGDPGALYGLARCKYDAHQPEEARDLLDTLLAHDPGNVPTLVERGRVALQLEGAAAAEGWLRQAVARAPQEATAQRLLLTYLEAQGKDADARAVRADLGRLQQDPVRRDVPK
jgi:tetratricopeptide (TPR) repeat protein